MYSAAEQSSEFSRPSKSSKPVRSRFSDEEDDVKPPKSRGARDDREDENYERNGRSKAPNSRGKRLAHFHVNCWRFELLIPYIQRLLQFEIWLLSYHISLFFQV